MSSDEKLRIIEDKKKSNRSPLTGKYLVKNPLGVAYLTCRDLFLKDCRSSEPIPTPKRILISNISHMGDVILSTVVLEPLKRAFPNAEIGFLVGSWSKTVIEGHQMIDHIHTFDHWKVNRSPISRWKKFQQHRQSKVKALQEIKLLNYDLAIDLVPYFPNSLPILSQAKIPCRIGYISGGNGPSLTHSRPWEDRDQSVGYYHCDFLRLFSIEVENPRPSLPQSNDKNAIHKLPEKFLEKGYLVFHMGAGHSLKEWPLEKWRKLTNICSDQGYQIVFTGKGTEENRNILTVTENISNVINLCDSINWKEFVQVIQNSKMLVCVDTAAVHVASCFDLPNVVLFCGINKMQHWRPTNQNAITLMAPVHCSPCFNKTGCEAMTCIREISVENVMEQIRKKCSNGFPEIN